MDKAEIQSYLYDKINDYSKRENQNKHLFQYIMYVYPYIYQGKTHWFLTHLIEILAYIDEYVKDYSKITIDKIETIGKNNPEQIFQILGEVLALYNLMNMPGADKSTIELEPKSYKGAKNPEFRMKLNDEWFAIEVKTPDLTPFKEIRHNGIQITSRLKQSEIEILKEKREIVFSKDLKIQYYLENANEKFVAYKQNAMYKDDKTILIIVWDDFINECVSTLVNPHSGLLTKESFYIESNFQNVDAVMVFRHSHHLQHLFYFGELLSYRLGDGPSRNVFDLSEYSITAGVYCKNPFSSKNILYDFLDIAYPISEEEISVNFVAEYQPTDIIDWTIALGISGLSYCSEELRYKIINLFKENREFKLKNSKITADLSVISLKRIIEDASDEEEALKHVKQIIKLSERGGMLNIPRIESDWNLINTINANVKKRFNKFKGQRLDSSCMCNSGQKYYDCCYKKLRYFKFTKYYTP
ncbi:hypothetical protein [Bacillus ndiopicus]|uniref:hypothetical protein n=1 Tax=Bacillus ndiopicus TaxID=1347368 RepID=UPI0005A7CA31|nr:hypothetical protein [Bacillus ndiopicus]